MALQAAHKFWQEFDIQGFQASFYESCWTIQISFICSFMYLARAGCKRTGNS